MRTVPLAGLVLSLGLFGCGRTDEQPAAAASGTTGSPSAEARALIAADALSRCAGMTPASAAAIVGAAEAVITDYSRTEGGLRMCHYGNSGDRRKSVSFTLSRKDSIELAAESLRSERETMGLAQGSIDRATGTQSKGAAVEDVSAIGDEAFYSPVNGAIMLRVANVIAQVTAPADMTLKKRAAEEVARGLRQ